MKRMRTLVAYRCICPDLGHGGQHETFQGIASDAKISLATHIRALRHQRFSDNPQLFGLQSRHRLSSIFRLQVAWSSAVFSFPLSWPRAISILKVCVARVLISSTHADWFWQVNSRKQTVRVCILSTLCHAEVHIEDPFPFSSWNTSCTSCVHLSCCSDARVFILNLSSRRRYGLLQSAIRHRTWIPTEKQK